MVQVLAMFWCYTGLLCQTVTKIRVLSLQLRAPCLGNMHTAWQLVRVQAYTCSTILQAWHTVNVMGSSRNKSDQLTSCLSQLWFFTHWTYKPKKATRVSYCHIKTVWIKIQTPQALHRSTCCTTVEVFQPFKRTRPYDPDLSGITSKYSRRPCQILMSLFYNWANCVGGGGLSTSTGRHHKGNRSTALQIKHSSGPTLSHQTKHALPDKSS